MMAAYRFIETEYCYGKTSALSLCELTIAANKVTALVGPNGAGKSTLLDLMAFITSPSAGEVFFQDEKVTPETQKEWIKKVGLVQQNPYLLRGSVIENVAIGLKLRGIPEKDRLERSEQVLQQLGIETLKERSGNSLSGGEAQKVAIARILVFEPEIILLDEPFTALDRKTIEDMEQLIHRLRRDENKTIVFSTHDQLRAQALADKVVSLVAGKQVNASLVNLWHGAIREQGVFDTGKLQVIVPTNCLRGEHLAIEPRQVVLSNDLIASSMRNSFPGRVVALKEEEKGVMVTVDAGENLQALVSHAALQEQSITLGSSCHVSFKSSSVEVF